MWRAVRMAWRSRLGAPRTFRPSSSPCRSKDPMATGGNVDRGGNSRPRHRRCHVRAARAYGPRLSHDQHGPPDRRPRRPMLVKLRDFHNHPAYAGSEAGRRLLSLRVSGERQSRRDTAYGVWLDQSSRSSSGSRAWLRCLRQTATRGYCLVLTTVAVTLSRHSLHAASPDGSIGNTSALEGAKAEAEQANRSKTSFVAAAVHDLMQPLNAARMFADAARTPHRGCGS